MTTANCGATDEFDFRLIFGEDGQPGPGPPLGPAGAPRGRGSRSGSCFPSNEAGRAAGAEPAAPLREAAARGERCRPSVPQAAAASRRRSRSSRGTRGLRGRWAGPAGPLPAVATFFGKRNPRARIVREEPPRAPWLRRRKGPGLDLVAPHPPSPGSAVGPVRDAAESSKVLTGPDQSSVRALGMKSFNRSVPRI